MECGKLSILLFILANLSFSVSQKSEVKKNESKQVLIEPKDESKQVLIEPKDESKQVLIEPKDESKQVLIEPFEQISLFSLNQKMEEMIALIEDNRKRARNTIRNTIEPVKRELTEKMEVLIKELKQKIDTNNKGLKMDLTNVMNNITEIKSDVKILDDKLNSVNNTLNSQVDKVKLDILVEHKIIQHELNELKQFRKESEINNYKLSTEHAKFNEFFNNKTNDNSENNKNELIELKTVINELKNFKVTSEMNDRNILGQLNKTTNNLESNNIKIAQHKTLIAEIQQFKVEKILKNGDKESGIRRVSVTLGQTTTVFCDQLTDGGGWTVFQSRDYTVTPRENFNRNWRSYETGFGNLAGEFWMGLDNINLMTHFTKMELRIDMENAQGAKKYANYKSFSIETVWKSSRLRIGSYTGDAGNGLGRNNLKEFSTLDWGNDGDKGENCAETRTGGWWYYAGCGGSNLNGGDYSNDSLRGISWMEFRGGMDSPRKVSMKFRPNSAT